MAGPARAAQYVRMSTEHQQYSTENQTDAMRRYAEARRMEVVRTYSDAARSGLNLEGRDGLRELLRDVESGRADFTDILVYDVSRWGRFQDADESAYYEYICKRANIRVHYCAEQFENESARFCRIAADPDRSVRSEWSPAKSNNYKKRLEARVGIEPTHKGFADLSLTTWVPRP